MEANDFYRESLTSFVHSKVGHATQSFRYCLSTVPPEREEEVLNLPVNPTYQTQLRNADGSENFPAGYYPAGTRPAG